MSINRRNNNLNLSNKAIIFARVSTQEQGDEGQSLDAQIANLKSYCNRNSLEVIKEYKLIESSSKGDRKKFNECLDFIRNQKEPINLICDKVDRLQRSILDMPKINQMIEDRQMSLHFLDIGRLDSNSNAQQKAFYRMAVVFANSYIDSISDNVKRTNKDKIKKGTILRDSPIGYLNLKRDKKKDTDPIVIVDEERSPYIVRAFELYSTGGHSVVDITNILNSEGLTQKRKGYEGKPITDNIIARALQDPFYYGYMRVDNQLHKHHYPTLITEELFKQCEAVRLDRGKAKGRYLKKQKIYRKLNQETAVNYSSDAIADIHNSEEQSINRHNHEDITFDLYKGFIKCYHCGLNYISERKKKIVVNKDYNPELPESVDNPKKIEVSYRYLRTDKRHQKKLVAQGKMREVCTHCKNINEEVVNVHIAKALKSIQIPEEIIKKEAEKFKEILKEDGDSYRAKLKEKTDLLSKSSKRLENLRIMRLDGEIEQDDYLKIKEQLELDKKALEEDLEILNSRKTITDKNISDFFLSCNSLYDVFVSSSRRRKRDIINILFPNFWLNCSSACYDLQEPFKLMKLMGKIEPRWEWLRTHPCDRTITFIKNLNYEGIEQGKVGQETRLLQSKQEVRSYIVKHDLDYSRQGIEEVLSPENHSNNLENTRNSHYHNTKDMNLLISNMIQADVFSYGLNQINSIARI